MLYIYKEGSGSAVGELVTVLQSAQNITITEEINGERNLSFDLPYGDSKTDYVKINTLVKCNFNDQIYRVEKITVNKQNPPTISVYCQHIIFDSKKTFIPTFERTAGQYANAIFADIWANTDFVVMSDSEIAAQGMAAVSTYTDTDQQDKTTPYDLTTYLIENINQGEFYIDNKRIALVDEIGAKYNALVLDITKNMENITIETDVSTLITRLYPFGKTNGDLNDYLGVPYIDSPNIGKYGTIEGYMDFPTVTDAEMLYERASWCFDSQNQNRIDVPYVTISGKFIDMYPIDNGFQRPHLGQRVQVEGYDNQRIIKIVWKPQTPYDTEITIGQVKKDLFYYFKRFNNTTEEYNASAKDPTINPAIHNTIVEVTKQEVVAADVIEASAAFIDDLQVERIQTNLQQFICTPNLTVPNDVAKWTDEEHTYKAQSNTNIRGYIKMEGLSQQFIEAHLVQPSDYNKLTSSEVQPLTVNGRQLYFTSISGAQAFQYLTFVAPKTKYPNLTSEQEAMYVVQIRKTEAEYIKMEQVFAWSNTDNTYYVKTIFGTGDENGNGRYYFVKDADSGRFVYLSRVDGKEYGIAEKDDGTYQVSGDVLTKIYPMAVVNDISQADTLPTGSIVFLGAIGGG